jgi:hypothetical protein
LSYRRCYEGLRSQALGQIPNGTPRGLDPFLRVDYRPGGATVREATLALRPMDLLVPLLDHYADPAHSKSRHRSEPRSRGRKKETISTIGVCR